MSSYLSEKYKNFKAYTPGEQPRDKKYIKLNTNESPFPPSPFAQRMAREIAGELQLYSDPTVKPLNQTAAEIFGIGEDEILFTNGSDEALSFIFLAFCDEKRKAVFPDITYGFYKVLSDLYGIKYREIPLKDDFSIDPDDYTGINDVIFIANPNAQTGLYLVENQIDSIIKNNSGIVVIDEAYADFAKGSVKHLIKKYDNLIVTGTFSKSRSLAGGRLGYAIANREIIKDLNIIKYSVNPYNVNKMTMEAGIGALIDERYFKRNIETIIENREYLKDKLRNMGFEVTDSRSNFILAKSGVTGGEELYLSLKEKGILVRHFNDERIKDYIRITIGTMDEINTFLEKVKEIQDENQRQYENQ